MSEIQKKQASPADKEAAALSTPLPAPLALEQLAPSPDATPASPSSSSLALVSSSAAPSSAASAASVSSAIADRKAVLASKYTRIGSKVRQEEEKAAAAVRADPKPAFDSRTGVPLNDAARRLQRDRAIVSAKPERSGGGAGLTKVESDHLKLAITRSLDESADVKVQAGGDGDSADGGGGSGGSSGASSSTPTSCSLDQVIAKAERRLVGSPSVGRKRKPQQARLDAVFQQTPRPKQAKLEPKQEAAGVAGGAAAGGCADGAPKSQSPRADRAASASGEGAKLQSGPGCEKEKGKGGRVGAEPTGAHGQVGALAKQLEGCKDLSTNLTAHSTRAAGILRALAAIPMTMGVLQDTKVGLAVARVRKAASGELKALAKSLIRAWRKETDSESRPDIGM